MGRYGKLLGEPPQNFEIHTTLHEKRSYQNTMPVSSYQICARFSLDESHHRFLGEVDRGDLCFHWRKEHPNSRNANQLLSEACRQLDGQGQKSHPQKG